MSPVFPDEKKGFVIFLCLVILTAAIFIFNFQSTFLFGFLGICWGGFGFFRLLYLVSEKANILTQTFSLPAKLLFGLGQAQQNARNAILYRLGQVDILLWFGLGLLWMGWLVYCSLFPSELSIVHNLHLQQSALLQQQLVSLPDYYALVAGLSFYAMIGVMVFLAMSYGRNPRLLDVAFYTFIPVFVLGLVWFSITGTMTDNLLWPALGSFSGGGLGQADILAVLAPDLMAKSGSAFLGRFAEGGFVASYGLYVLYVPVLWRLIAAFWAKARSMLVPAIGLLVLVCLAALDVFWLASGMGLALSVIGLALLALCWGASGRSQ